ncbi:MAG TPA: pantoate--beta-alanine ligase [Chitinispirillaceae bacterium]|nr:pantoate--beta-alanine ligase [Chitinispirillaceae bacterium]
MKIVKSPAEMKNLSMTIQRSGSSVGLVPTMGALHKGHISLLDRIKNVCDFSVMSIFVNPVQFGPMEDFQKYPRPFEADCELADKAGCDVIFAPSKEDMYPENYCTYVNVEDITDGLCGASRPGHFRGVATVVLKFFNIVMPQIASFGQKDAQQVLIIKRMVHDLNLSVAIDVAPIFREESGLALSSRNVYLSSAERDAAPLIYKGLNNAFTQFNAGVLRSDTLVNAVTSVIGQSPLLEIEYVELVDTLKIKPVTSVASTALIAVACRTKESRTRLIDNIVIGGTL